MYCVHTSECLGVPSNCNTNNVTQYTLRQFIYTPIHYMCIYTLEEGLSYLIWYKQQLSQNKNKPLKRQQVFMITNDTHTYTQSYGIMSRKRQHYMHTAYMYRYHEVYVTVFSALSLYCEIQGCYYYHHLCLYIFGSSDCRILL